MVEFKERLQAAMDHSKVSREVLRAKLSVTRVAIDKLLDGRSKAMSAENCAHAARFMGVSIYWLATGLGEMCPEDSDRTPTTHMAAECVAHYRSKPEWWPMQTVTLDEYLTLSERQQGIVEGRVREMLDGKSSGNRSAA
ncbi:hypothetical protein Alide_3567 [Alicycliphilus denitrificans BC]|nr:hypothetical protein Alide_3567 [Alicycliphilus denitrificans BC]